MIEILLVLSLLGNGWQFYEGGKTDQSNIQLVAQIKQNETDLEGFYKERVNHDAIMVKVERDRKNNAQRSEDHAVELERLRNSNSDVNSFLELEIPSDLVLHIKSRASSSNKDSNPENPEL
jgi:Tfp pilus assembly protein PilO